MPSITTEQRAQVQLEPALLRKLRLKLKTYASLRDTVIAAKAAQDKIKTEVESLFAEGDQYDALIAGCRVDDFPLKIVSGTQKKLDKKFLVAQGWVSQAQLNEATKEVPKKPYLKVTCPGEHEEADE